MFNACVAIFCVASVRVIVRGALFFNACSFSTTLELGLGRIPFGISESFSCRRAALSNEAIHSECAANREPFGLVREATHSEWVHWLRRLNRLLQGDCLVIHVLVGELLEAVHVPVARRLGGEMWCWR